MKIWNDIEIEQSFNNFLYSLDKYNSNQTFNNFSNLKQTATRYEILAGTKIIWFNNKSLYLSFKIKL